jgi:hypothetical protein
MVAPLRGEGSPFGLDSRQPLVDNAPTMVSCLRRNDGGNDGG